MTSWRRSSSPAFRLADLGRPEDIAGLSVFLASDASAWITGALIPFDGGNLALNAGGTPGPLQPHPPAPSPAS